jgi:hypothetical protein
VTIPGAGAAQAPQAESFAPVALGPACGGAVLTLLRVRCAPATPPEARRRVPPASERGLLAAFISLERETNRIQIATFDPWKSLFDRERPISSSDVLILLFIARWMHRNPGEIRNPMEIGLSFPQGVRPAST